MISLFFINCSSGTISAYLKRILDLVDIKALINSSPRKYRSILIFGPPGAGKGTLGKFLSSAGNHFHLSSGDIFRGLSPESPAGKIYHSYAGKGHLLPDD